MLECPCCESNALSTRVIDQLKEATVAYVSDLQKICSELKRRAIDVNSVIWEADKRLSEIKLMDEVWIDEIPLVTADYEEGKNLQVDAIRARAVTLVGCCVFGNVWRLAVKEAMWVTIEGAAEPYEIIVNSKEPSLLITASESVRFKAMEQVIDVLGALCGRHRELAEFVDKAKKAVELH
jgi:hypothetical protein